MCQAAQSILHLADDFPLGGIRDRERIFRLGNGLARLESLDERTSLDREDLGGQIALTLIPRRI
jgi:hypothetical protein